MASSKTNNVGYVVFNGRKNGVYRSWVDCYGQVNGFKEGVVRVYDTDVEAEFAWEMFLKIPKSMVRSKLQIEASLGTSSAHLDEILNSIRNSYGETVESTLGPPIDSLMNLSMQKWLSQACIIMRIHQPDYTLHDKIFIKGVQYYKFRCSLRTDAIGRPPVSMGRYAKTEEQGREDVAVLMLRRLLSSHGKKLGDYNSHNVELLEDQLKKSLETNVELRMENATLLVELEMVKENLEKDLQTNVDLRMENATLMVEMEMLKNKIKHN